MPNLQPVLQAEAKLTMHYITTLHSWYFIPIKITCIKEVYNIYCETFTVKHTKTDNYDHDTDNFKVSHITVKGEIMCNTLYFKYDKTCRLFSKI